ncbi:hypothetical protein T484DRAFT_1762372 [Baffinella frigidus]|nr:hypothetical protein T484DRAFT_1762372 [Cryptophyta sp. CCMP2293]
MSGQETPTQNTWGRRAMKQALVRHREFMKTFACDDEELQPSSSQIFLSLSLKKVCTGEDEGDEQRKVFSARARRTERNRRALQSAECLDDCEPVCLDACDDDRASRTASLRGVKSLMDLPRYVKSVQTCSSTPESPTVGTSPRAIPDMPSNMLLAFESVEDWGRSAGVPSPERARYGAGFHPLSATHTALRTTCDVLQLQLESYRNHHHERFEVSVQQSTLVVL